MGNIRKLITLLLISASTFGQLPTALDSLVIHTYSTRTYGYFKPTGWSPTDPNSILIIFFMGNGETSATMPNLVKNAPGNNLNDAGTNWNGRAIMNDGTIKRNCIYMIPNYGDGSIAVYASAIQNLIQQLGMDTTDKRRFIIMGLSGGGGRMEDYITMTGHTSPYANLFERICFLSSVGTRNFSTWKPYKVHVWVSGTEHDPTTPFTNNIATYNSFKGNKRLVQLATSGHSNAYLGSDF